MPGYVCCKLQNNRLSSNCDAVFSYISYHEQ